MTKTPLPPPFLIIGPPRVGSTFLCHVLNEHPQIHCTDEARPFLAAAKALAPVRARYGAQDGYRPLMLSALRDSIVEWYRGRGVSTGVRWGDKFPHYADPNWCPEMLESVEELFPRTKYIFATRGKRDTVRSMRAVNRDGWFAKDPAVVFDEITARGVEWEQHVGPDRFLRVEYETPLQERVDQVLSFLGLGWTSEMDIKVIQELTKPTRYSTPTSW